MAKLNIDGTVEFNNEDVEFAWNNAVVLKNMDEKKFRMCFICQFHMEKKDSIFNGKNDITSWGIALINASKPNFDQTNLIATHEKCIELRSKVNSTKILAKIKKIEWEFDKDFYNKK